MEYRLLHEIMTFLPRKASGAVKFEAVANQLTAISGAAISPRRPGLLAQLLLAQFLLAQFLLPQRHPPGREAGACVARPLWHRALTVAPGGGGRGQATAGSGTGPSPG